MCADWNWLFRKIVKSGRGTVIYQIAVLGDMTVMVDISVRIVRIVVLGFSGRQFQLVLLLRRVRRGRVRGRLARFTETRFKMTYV